mmetsp:Transcript_25348/g.55067  ORF Transcript_25348/g.55067 Transcript_25348/m.55067 type:complete len:82 (-) Transcript_25348:198-443(-)
MLAAEAGCFAGCVPLGVHRGRSCATCGNGQSVKKASVNVWKCETWHALSLVGSVSPVRTSGEGRLVLRSRNSSSMLLQQPS